MNTHVELGSFDPYARPHPIENGAEIEITVVDAHTGRALHVYQR
ncbi:hypothetical protein QE392_001100 [Microbacterium proteolyticum]|nr:hypothetical protein [Microbacterium sp. SORGH_AS_0344]MDQ1169296.1 hypothetical protein [Microbacterium proteolyticum]